MSTSHKSFDTAFDLGPATVPTSRRRDQARLLVVPLLAVPLALVATSAIISASWLLALLAILAVLALAGAYALTISDSSAADTVVLVGRSPMAAVIASSLTQASGQRGQGARRILRAQTLAEAATLVRTAHCSEVIVAGPTTPGNLELVDARGRRPSVVAGEAFIERLLGRIPTEFVAQDRWFTALGQVRQLSPTYAWAKRALDVVLALTLGIAALPALALVALLIKLDSPGPVLFVQSRVGLGGKPFRIYKFRTMRDEPAPPAATGDWTKEVWTQQGDPRVTRLGRLLRVTRIDEVPQLWNVLKGEMSFVGPRPEWTKSTAMLEQVLPEYSKRYAVKPGLTGWAQVCYRYTNSIDGQRRKLEYDLYYVKHASLRLDLVILFRTAFVVLGRRGL